MISYEPFFNLLKEKGITTYALFKMGFSATTYYRMKEGKAVKTDTLGQLCELLDCRISDLVIYIKKNDL